LASPFEAGFEPPLGLSPSPVASAVAAAGAGFSGAFVALAPFANAFAASASSTLEEAVVTSSPACLSAARASFEVIPLSFAISWTRFFAIL